MMVGVVKVIDVVMELFDVACAGVVVAKVAVYLFFSRRSEGIELLSFLFLNFLLLLLSAVDQIVLI